MIDRFLRRLLGIRYTPWLFVIMPLIVGGVRIIAEHAIVYGLPAGQHLHPITGPGFLLQNLSFYVFVQISILACLTLASGRDYRELTGVVSVGLVIAWLPPLIDGILPAQEGARYTFFESVSPSLFEDHLLVGESITLWLVIATTAGFTAWLTRRPLRALAAGALVYGTVLAGGWGSAALARAIAPDPMVRPTADVSPGLPLSGALVPLILVTAAFILYVALNWSSLRRSVGRVVHAAPWGCLTAAGARMAGAGWLDAAIKAFVVVFAVLLAVITNDYHDRQQDAAGSAGARGVTGEDSVVATFFQFLLVATLFQLYPTGVFILVLFFALIAAYHHPELRFKRLFCLSYKMEATAAVGFFLFGCVGPVRFPQETWVPIIAGLLFGGFSLGSMIKDYKDIDSDRRAGIGTIYTRLLARGHSLQRVHLAVSLAFAVMLHVPVIWFLTLDAVPWGAPILAGLAPLSFVALMAGEEPARAVRRTLLVLTLYLAIFAASTPALA